MVRQACELAIHSTHRERTVDNLTSVNDYKWSIGRVLKNVESIEVLYAEIPNSYYNIPEGSNTLQISMNSTTYTITIPPGNYSDQNIHTTLNTLVSTVLVDLTDNVVLMSDLIEFGVDEVTTQLTITHRGNVSDGGSINSSTWPYALGWINDLSWDELSSGTTWHAGSTLRLAPESVVYLSIAELGVRGSRFLFGSSNPHPQIDFDHVLTRFQTGSGVNFMNFFNNERNMHERHFDPDEAPLHLSQLTIRFLRPDGSLIHFNGFDHSMHVRVVYND